MLRLLASTAVAALLGTTAAQADYVLNVLHTNDFHSRMEPINRTDATCDAETEAKGECVAGVARLAAKVKELRAQIAAEGGNVILLDAGDQYQGSLYYTTYKGDDTIEMMNAIGYDAMALGNHEFDDGPEGALKLIEGTRFKITSGNLDVSQSNVLRGRLNDTVVLEVGGQRIGIVSALATDTPETASPGPNVIFQDDIESLKADAQTLTDQGVDKIIALTHVGYGRDQEIAAQVPGVDAVVGGHTHSLLGGMEGAQGPYPTLVKGTDATDVPVVSANNYGKYLGRLILTFDDNGKLLKAEGAPIPLDASVTPDPAIAARVAELGGPIQELRDRQVAEIAAPIDGARENCRARECEMGVVVTDAMLDRVKDQGVTIAIENGGGLRASIDAGPVTMGEVISVLPFQNTLSTFEVTGATLLDALENGASQYEEAAGRFTQVSGLKYTVDPAAAAGARISEVQVQDDAGAWGPIDAAATYKVVSNNYIRNGGDGYAMFVDAANPYDFGPDLADVLGEYLAQQGPGFRPALEGRITFK